MSLIRSAGLVTFALSTTAIAGTPNLLINGSFEDSTLNPGSAWSVLGGGNTSIEGWTTIGGGIDYFGVFIAASDGIHSLDINNISSGGGIEQSFATVIGATYDVSFDMSANMFGAPAEKVMNVSAGGSSQDFVFNYVAAGSTAADPKWETMTWSFVATSTTSTLRFTGVSGGVYGAALDNVIVTGIPAPGAMGLLSIAGLCATRRKR
jgi:choice-of-anchor C domain-containing protein